MPFYPPDRLDAYARKVLGRLLASTSDSGKQGVSPMREIERVESLLAERDATVATEHTAASYRSIETAPLADRIPNPSSPPAGV